MDTGAKRFFTDSNLLIYTVDARNPDKQRRADEWMRRLWTVRTGLVSWQVLHEFYWNATRKLREPAERIRVEVRRYCQWDPVAATPGLVERAWRWCDQAQLAYWDGLIVAAAERCEADYLLSEDFQAGRKFGKCTVVNPFARDPADYLAAGAP